MKEKKNPQKQTNKQKSLIIKILLWANLFKLMTNPYTLPHILNSIIFPLSLTAESNVVSH